MLKKIQPITNCTSYLITENGKLYSLIRNKWMKLNTNKKGYITVRLKDNNGKYKTFLFHRLIADTFIKNTTLKPEVNHIDGNKLNNDISNLEWVTSKENSIHAWKMGLHENTRRAFRKNINIDKRKKVICIETGIEYESAISASKSLKLSDRAVAHSIRENRSIHKKYTFKYL